MPPRHVACPALRRGSERRQGTKGQSWRTSRLPWTVRVIAGLARVIESPHGREQNSHAIRQDDAPPRAYRRVAPFRAPIFCPGRLVESPCEPAVTGPAPGPPRTGARSSAAESSRDVRVAVVGNATQPSARCGRASKIHDQRGVPRRGIEPLHPCGLRILSPPRLPVPPPRRAAHHSARYGQAPTRHRSVKGSWRARRERASSGSRGIAAWLVARALPKTRSTKSSSI